MLRTLLTGERILSLAVVVDGTQVAGVPPFLAEPGLASLLVHTSALVRAPGLSARIFAEAAAFAG